ncbi:hypothetical protein NG895_22715 [Aeoliella sp. ICT_H6.2]|uniref:Immunity MXAN-0049 protein domain-containing protein n=1 Tax=Aeoliella straminimaris TaxID=2954799 RepID=A0A9X2FDN8_9BACT|nr:DUF1629 domain-containing protein [Aeoliella straminimaris]MCO6046719.1 hypothetical protein [Aeoliella straminimaris]
MEFYVWDYLDYTRAARTGYAEFKTLSRDSTGRRKLSKNFPSCPHCGVRIGYLVWLPPFRIKLTTTKLGDLCTDGLTILVSKQFREAWQQRVLKGVEFVTDPVKTDTRKGELMEYQVVRIPDVITRLDESASGLEIEKMDGCGKCRAANRKRVRRIRVDESSWEGQDAFHPSGLYGVTLVTSRFVETVRDFQLTNFHFIHQDDYFEPKTYDHSL